MPIIINMIGKVQSVNLNKNNHVIVGETEDNNILFDNKPETTKGTQVESQRDIEDIFASRLFSMLNENRFYASENIDEILLIELDILKNMDLVLFLDYFRACSGGMEFIDFINSRDDIKKSTKNKFNDYFENNLSDVYGFDKRYTNKKVKTEFETGDYKYVSDTYNVKQKNENILEIKNLTTNEIRVINFEQFIPKELNGLAEIISLKSAIQKLPPEILFQMPEEISMVLHIKMIESASYTEDAPEIMPNYGGAVMHGTDMQLFVADGYARTLVHEVAHTVFINDKNEDVLATNPDMIRIYNQALERLKNDGIEPYDYKGMQGNPEFYWSSSVEELGAEIVSAVFGQDDATLENIKKYAPEAIPLVMEIFEQRQQASDRHQHYTVEELIESVDE